jgi:hypothetical protein
MRIIAFLNTRPWRAPLGVGFRVLHKLWTGREFMSKLTDALSGEEGLWVVVCHRLTQLSRQ